MRERLSLNNSYQNRHNKGNLTSLYKELGIDISSSVIAKKIEYIDIDILRIISSIHFAYDVDPEEAIERGIVVQNIKNDSNFLEETKDFAEGLIFYRNDINAKKIRYECVCLNDKLKDNFREIYSRKKIKKGYRPSQL